MDVSSCLDALNALVPEILKLTGAPGLSIAVGVGEEVVWAGGYGVADLASGRPMTTDAVGPTGSDCKPYTAVAAMQLVERGLIGLDDPVNDYLDADLRVVNPLGAREITLRDLLIHRSGLGTNFGNCSRTPPAPLGEHLRRVFREARSDAYGGSVLPFWATQVGAHYQYSNVGIALVGYLVELLNPDRVSFSEWVRRHVFTPLGMTSTCFPPAQHPDHVPADIYTRRSTGYATLGGFHFRLPQIYVGDYPAGTALTTPSDHARFLLAMTGGGALGGARVLRPETVARMITPQAGRGPDPSAAIGLVWSVFDHGTPQGYFGHGGEYMWGWHNVSRAWPHHRVCVTANVNQWDMGDLGSSDRPSHLAGRLALRVVTAWVNGQDPRPPRDAASAQSYLAGLLVGDRLTTRLGITTRPTEAEIARIAQTAVVASGTPWDPTAFQDALREGHITGDVFTANAELIRREIPDSQRELVARQLGVPGFGRHIPGLS
ncbi:serine hydrolase domain-containing protein [Goodfellowiella coeruleoviolacea]|uniref:CubicO group peptidase, beta-lactamase class C family n=1 Tax=Goodfellowiella coeruleoviolacea TaxID=334858 RepID=A0AAE3GG99_9PSEU|nr:serine hydrolase domain-containing protein [Goodfellowiella coeruleoviolacea]MCP2166800.1 CubicO group peptidase, beta-lactamase class C family [Goodfellowiella coeruleoviolacea]